MTHNSAQIAQQQFAQQQFVLQAAQAMQQSAQQQQQMHMQMMHMQQQMQQMQMQQKMQEMQDKQLTASFGKDEKKMAQVSLTNGVMPDSYAKIFTDCKQGDPVDDLWKFSLAKVGAAMKDYNFIKKKEMHSFLFLQCFVSLAAAGAVWAYEIPASLANIYKPFQFLCFFNSFYQQFSSTL